MARGRGPSWPIAPMKAIPAELPDASPAWMFEPKWDGHRALVRVDGDGLDVVSSNGKPKLGAWPWISAVRDQVASRDVVLDGEVIAVDDSGRHRFEYIGDVSRPHALVLFDVLRYDGAWVLDTPWSERRQLLEGIVTPAGAFTITPVSADGAALWDVVVEAGYEGVVSKRVDSTYQPGKRSPLWRKTKARHQQEFVVGGWLAGSGRRGGTLGSLLLGVHEPDGSLRYVGGVGSGFDDRTLDAVRDHLTKLRTTTCPFAPAPPRPVSTKATWCRPTTVVEVEFAEWTSGGQLRHPVYLGLRDDVDPATVTAAP